MSSSFSCPPSPFSVFSFVNSMVPGNIVARLANTVGAAESVLRVAATGHDKRLFLKASSVFFCLLGYYITVEEILLFDIA
ncbi:hypothetical protein YC2023_103816 [Brassica napus]|uniref:(rape) hypothetical protein n=1 Tax=Brassica napus TaxID=3708 RepID=A0A816UQN1_BRANA|nr:unnamed protein product [Brassica napus]